VLDRLVIAPVVPLNGKEDDDKDDDTDKDLLWEMVELLNDLKL
jgi:hypothetical protein